MSWASDSTVVVLFLSKNMFLSTTLCVEETRFHNTVVDIFCFEGTINWEGLHPTNCSFKIPRLRTITGGIRTMDTTVAWITHNAF